MIRIAIAALALLAATAPGFAAENPKNIGNFKDWSVWKYSARSKNRCFIYANPAKKSPRSLDHGLVSFFIRSTVRKDLRSEASIQVGYDFKKGTEAKLNIDGERFRLMTSGKGAWLALGGNRERDLLGAMKSGKVMTVSATSARGNTTRYTFPLSGVSAAMEKLRTVCP